MVSRGAFFWASPMVNVYNRRLAVKDLSESGPMGRIVPVAPFYLLRPNGGGSLQHLRQQADRKQVFLSDLDQSGAQLNGADKYIVTFARDNLTEAVWGRTPLESLNLFHKLGPLIKEGSKLCYRARLMMTLGISIALLAWLPATDSLTQDKLTEDDALKLGVEAYIYGYPLVLMHVTRQVMTAVPRPDGKKAPVNQFVHAQEFPDYTFADVVSPNADTLYSFAWLDLRQEPIVLSVPDVGKRYYLMQMMDAWTNVFASPGSRTTGHRKGEFAIVGPRWTGKMPKGVKMIESSTSMVWLIGRTQTNGKDDYVAVHAIQKQYRLTPLSAWGKAFTPPDRVPFAARIDMETPPVDQVARMDATTFFDRLNALMLNNPPALVDAAAMKRFAAIGIAPGKPFDLQSLDPVVAKGLERSVAAGQAKIVTEAKKPHGRNVNGWQILPDNTGKFGADYNWRAVVALIGLGANLPWDAIYPHATVDTQGQPLTGANRYTIRFRKGQLPPVNGFWSITMYNAKQAFVQNAIDRYAIGDRDKLQFNNDGSLTLYVQHDSPGKDKESNWLPAPVDSFNLFMRLDWPKKEIVDGTWKMPPIEREK
jgi:hypothetical protein